MEFYNGKEDTKFLHFQNKLQDLIQKPQVMKMLNAKAGITKTVEEQKEEMKEEMEKETEKFEATQGLESMLTSHKSKREEAIQKIESDINSQEEQMRRRIEERKMRKQTR